jgi:hypothetical protein
LKESTTCLTERHLFLFGTIVQWFARYELVMQKIMATVSHCDSASIMVLTRGLDFGQKRIALLDLLRHRTVPLNQYDKICSYLLVPHDLKPLLKDIMHSVWVKTSHPDSIQPDWIMHWPSGIRPLREGSGDPDSGFVAMDADKTGYTLDDLNIIVSNLATNHELFMNYLREIGLIGED